MDFITDEERNKRTIDFFDRMKANVLKGNIQITSFEVNYGWEYDDVEDGKKVLSGLNSLKIFYEQKK